MKYDSMLKLYEKEKAKNELLIKERDILKRKVSNLLSVFNGMKHNISSILRSYNE